MNANLKKWLLALALSLSAAHAYAAEVGEKALDLHADERRSHTAGVVMVGC